MEKCEKKALLLYVCNLLSNRRMVKRNLTKIIEWFEDSGQNLVSFKFNWLTKEEKETYCDVDELYRMSRQRFINRVPKFYDKLFNYASTLKLAHASSLEIKAENIGNLLKLSKEEQDILLALFRFNMEKDFEELNDKLEGSSSNLLPYYLGIPESVYSKAIGENSKLRQYGFIEFDYNHQICWSDLAKKLAEKKLQTPEDIKEYLIGKTLKANLDWADFGYVEEKDYCAKLIKRALSAHTKGVNILFYGTHGTGKTEFAKTLACHIKAELYGLGENFDADNRREKLDLAHRLLEKSSNTCLLIDEADDFLEESSCFHYRSRHDNNKLYVNRVLENNRMPTIWIINDIEYIDKAFLRRFTFSVNFSKPTLKTRTQMWQKALHQNHLPDDEKTAEDFAIQYRLSPAFIVTAIKSAKLARGGLTEVKQSLNALEKAYCDGRAHCPTLKKETNFNVNLLNTDTDLEKLAEQIKKLPQQNFSLCLYGASGTGKSAYAEYLAEKIGLPVIKKRCSDLLSKWVGGTEQNIARAFEEGRDNQALLIFDEADSFLQDRSGASRSWEITQVNEMLTQMETYPYPFVCTTNLMDRLDKASLRRFTFKVGYEYMTPEQASLAFAHFFGMENTDLSYLNSLAPGDFVVVKQKARIMGYLDNKDELIKMLEQEQKQKAPVSHRMGFC